MKKRYLILIAAVLGLGAVLLKNPPSPEEIVEPDEETLTRPQEFKKEDLVAKPMKKPAEVGVPAGQAPELPSLDEFPTIADLKDLSDDEVHHTPEVVMNGGRLVGQLIDRAEKNPALREKTLQLLKSCAESDDVVTAVRAVCWKNTVTQMKNWRVFVPLSDTKVPANVLELSSQLP